MSDTFLLEVLIGVILGEIAILIWLWWDERRERRRWAKWR